MTSILFGITAHAQLQVEIREAGTGETLPGAHVFVTDTSTMLTTPIIGDYNGRAFIPADMLQHGAVGIRISYLGFKEQRDTLLPSHTPVVYELLADASVLNEVVVTAQYAENSPEKAVHKIRIIDEQKIDRMAAVSVEDVLQNEVNIRISQDAVLGSSISMQGVGGQNVKIMIDGVPIVGRQNGNIDLNQINLQDVERIEIVEGPLSVNYGTDALAGTINIITRKKSADRYRLWFGSYNESIGTYNLNGGVSGRWRAHHVSVSGGRNFFNGWSDGDAVEPNNALPVADSTRHKQWNPKEQFFGRIQWNTQIGSWNIGYKFEAFDEKITSRGYPRPPYNESAFDDYFYTRRRDHSITASGDLNRNWRVNAVAAMNGFARQKNTYLKDLTTLEQTLSTAPGLNDTSMVGFWMSRASLAYVRRESKIHGEVGYDVNTERASGVRIASGRRQISDFAVFTTAEWRIAESLVVRPGLRCAYNSVYGAPLTPSLNVKYTVGQVALRASYARGFRAPSLKELYFDFVDINHNITGNTALKAEYSHNYTLNASHQRLIAQRIFKIEAGAYYNDIRNLITLGIVDAETQQYAYINVGRSQTTGFNVNSSVLLEHLKLSAGSALVGMRRDFEEGSGPTALRFYPEVTSNLTYDWHRTGLQLNAFYKYQGALPATAIAGDGALSTTYVGAYHLLDANIVRAFFNNRLGVGLGVKNILNVTNVNLAGGSGSGGVHSGSAGSAAVGTGRTYFVKLDLNLNRRGKTAA